MVNLFNNRFFNVCTILLFLYFGFETYKSKDSTPVSDLNRVSSARLLNNANHAKYTISFDLNKKKEDYTFSEKVIYHVFNKDIEATKTVFGDPTKRNEANSNPRFKTHGSELANGDHITFSYRIISGLSNNPASSTFLSKTILWGNYEISSILAEKLQSLPVGQIKNIEISAGSLTGNNDERLVHAELKIDSITPTPFITHNTGNVNPALQ